MPFTTRAPSHDVETLFPFLKGAGRTTVRLHPRRSSNLDPATSKIGGKFVWPKDEPQPICPKVGCPAVPVLQLLMRDFPEIDFPPETDLLQILWYPSSYANWNFNPQVLTFWRTSRLLNPESFIEPVYKKHEPMYELKECGIFRETVTEYPYVGALTRSQQAQIHRWEETKESPEYQYCLSTCPGTKIGGHPQFAGQEAPSWVVEPRPELFYLLTLSDDEWDGGSFPRWRPVEQEFPPGRRVTVELPGGAATSRTVYTEEEKEELKSWTDERRSKYQAAQAPLGTYLKCPVNLFIDKSVNPWACRSA